MLGLFKQNPTTLASHCSVHERLGSFALLCDQHKPPNVAYTIMRGAAKPIWNQKRAVPSALEGLQLYRKREGKKG